jgi:hypothetical protein
MQRIRLLLICLVIFCDTTSLFPQAAASSPAIASATTVSEPHRGDIPDLIRETQLGVRANGYSGFIWWIPSEFWTQAVTKRGGSADKAAETFRPLREYTMIYLLIAKVSDLGVFDFAPPDQLRKKVFLRDSSGVDYPALDDVGDAAKNLAGMMKPMLSNAMGKAGENSTVLFFPAKTKAGLPIADPLAKGSFSLVLKDVVGVPQDVYEWRLPLTSLSAAKYCPYGKERVNANWSFCPWHGVALNNSTVLNSAK